MSNNVTRNTACNKSLVFFKSGPTKAVARTKEDWFIHGFYSAWASRDAEVAELKERIALLESPTVDEHDFIGRSPFEALKSEVAALRGKLDTARGALKNTCWCDAEVICSNCRALERLGQ